MVNGDWVGYQLYISENFYACTDEMLLCLAEMYVGDERFRSYIDKNGEGTAEFMNAAIIAHCKGRTDGE